jgi:hypothetical protein
MMKKSFFFYLLLVLGCIGVLLCLQTALSLALTFRAASIVAAALTAALFLVVSWKAHSNEARQPGARSDKTRAVETQPLSFVATALEDEQPTAALGASSPEPPTSPPLIDQLQADLAELHRRLAEIEASRARRVDESLDAPIESASLEEPSPRQPPPGDDVLKLGYHAAVEEFKRRLIGEAIARYGGNRAEAARRLGLQRTYLYRLIKQLGVPAVDGTDRSGAN